MKWTNAYKNRLPDEAYLIILKGGKKVAGRTRPQHLRKLPVKNHLGAVDPGHLQAARGRVAQVHAPAAVKQQAKARVKALVARQVKEEVARTGGRRKR